MTTHILTFDFPLPRTHTGVALGNGNAGVLVWGNKPDCLNLTVSRNDFWDHRNGGRLWESDSYRVTQIPSTALRTSCSE